MPVDFIEEAREQVYDKDKYREMLLEAAETVLGYFGFDRTLVGGFMCNGFSQLYYIDRYQTLRSTFKQVAYAERKKENLVTLPAYASALVRTTLVATQPIV
jgi:hypothetical protein